jgi:thiol:disulfide interchange protein DsbC
MKTRFLLAAALAAACLPALADEALVRKSLEQNLPGATVGAIRKLPNVDLYEAVVNGRNIVYTDPKGETAFVGRMIDVRSQRNLTQERVDELTRVDFGKLPLERAIVTVKGSGARKVAVFSDPDCPYCKQLERELAAVTDVTIYTFLFPLTSVHPDAMRKARLVWCAPDRASAWSDIMLKGREPDNAATCESPIGANLELGAKLNIEGTPGIVFASGRLVPGAIKREQIERYLDEKARSAELWIGDADAMQ